MASEVKSVFIVYSLLSQAKTMDEPMLLEVSDVEIEEVFTDELSAKEFVGNMNYRQSYREYAYKEKTLTSE